MYLLYHSEKIKKKDAVIIGFLYIVVYIFIYHLKFKQQPQLVPQLELVLLEHGSL